MSTRLTARFAAAAIALGFAASPAFAQTAPTTSTEPTATEPAATTGTTMHHRPAHRGTHRMTGEGKLQPTASGDAAVADLNAQSLAAAQAGQTFTPSGTPSSPAATAAPRAHGNKNM